MNRWFTLYLILLCCGVILLPSCKDDPVQPGNGADTTKTDDTTSHIFEWEVDTLFYEGTTMPAYLQAKAMYGASSTNVYLAGYSTTGKEMCWHGCGSAWKICDLSKYLGRDIVDIDGIDSTYIVFAGFDYGGSYASIAVLNNGIIETLPIPHGDGVRTCIRVVSRNEIYLGGVDGIQRYNGTEWEWMLDSTETTGNEFYPYWIYKYPTGEIEFVSQRNASGESTMYCRWEWQEERFVLCDSFTMYQTAQDSIRFGYAFCTSGEDVFCSGSGGTYMHCATGWEKIHAEGGPHVSGSRNDMIMALNWDYIWHYNGSSVVNMWDTITTLVPTLGFIHEVYYIDGHVFIMGELTEGSIPVVVHGVHISE